MELSLRHFYRKMLTLSVGHVVCLLALVGGVSSCSNPGVVTLNDKTRYSDVIVTGSIESKVGDGKYSLTVDCVLKDSGADIPGALNISGVETEEGGMCFVSEISEGKKWVLFLSSFYSMRYKEETYEDYSRIVQTGCDLHVKSTLPLGGVSKNCEDVVTRACPTQPPIVHTKSGVSKNCEDVVTRACPTQPPIVHTKSQWARGWGVVADGRCRRPDPEEWGLRTSLLSIYRALY
uniref:Lipoprotein n=1 Tax=Magallana gigas TaxID=29159 RepID=K1QYU6_MAGGI